KVMHAVILSNRGFHRLDQQENRKDFSVGRVPQRKACARSCAGGHLLFRQAFPCLRGDDITSGRVATLAVGSGNRRGEGQRTERRLPASWRPGGRRGRDLQSAQKQTV